MDLVWFGLAVLVVLFLVDRLMVWMESRGWVYWRTKGERSAGSAIVGAIGSIYDPSRVHTEDEIRRLQDDIEDEDEGAPPKMRFADGKVYVYKPKD